MEIPSFLTETNPPDSSGEWLVMIARREKFLSPFTMRLRDDIGDLKWGDSWIRVYGRRTHEFNAITDLTLVRQTSPWLAIVILNLVLLAEIFGSGMREFRPSNPFTWLMLAGINGLLLISTGVTKWLRVTYRPEPGMEQTVYLLAIRPNRMRRSAADMRKLFLILRDAVLVRPSGD